MITHIALEKPNKLKGLLKYREDLLNALSKLSRMKIREIGILGQNINRSMLISDKIEQVYKRLEEIERALIVKYNQRINFLILNLTVIETKKPPSICAFCSFQHYKIIISK